MNGMTEDDIKRVAHDLLGNGEEILGAGYFSLASLTLDGYVGTLGGALAGSDFGPVLDAFATVLGRHVVM